ncbi:M24 family metallopeptidase [Stygiolobus caldivivus]|uniref:Peptidase M24 family protein n=1 Tax=Stygiolobus caldivivus TaxID=2824673 RepID=A0A8D5U523_9CREN|nr:aminopeptidase P family protein [Stygiolobus caldivivus]BCU69409.1 peptidase M24 family protein [Stygiolobus caldivivus]
MKRVEKVKELMKKKNVDYLILGPTSNMFYLSGFVEEQMERPLLMIISYWDTYFLAPKLYEEQLTKLNFNVITYEDGENPYKKINIEKGRSIAIDDTLWSAFTIDLLEVFAPSRLVKASEIMKEIRMIKEEDEIDIMSQGLRIAEKSFTETLEVIKEGITEKEISTYLSHRFIENGAEGVSFEPIVTSGSNTSMPHLRSTSKKIKRGDIIIFDFGVKYRGYSTDTTRVVSLGPPSEDVKKIFEIVKEAQLKAEESAIEGIRACEVDKVARGIIAYYGYGDKFIHRTGHGIGIDVHEEPYIAPDYKRTIQNQMVFTIEPGIYLPEKFGIRIEDMVYVKSGKPVMMNSLEKDIFVV